MHEIEISLSLVEDHVTNGKIKLVVIERIAKNFHFFQNFIFIFNTLCQIVYFFSLYLIIIRVIVEN